MAEVSKYRRNIWKAEAVESIASSIISHIESEKGDIEFYKSRNESCAEENKDNPDYKLEEDYRYESNLREIEKIKEKIKLWEQLLKVIDKEMAF